MAIEGFKRALNDDEWAMLPSRKLLPFHPFQFLGQLVEVWKIQTYRVSAETEEKRQRGVADAQKRAAYRKAHGIEVGGIAGLLGMGVEDPPEQQRRSAGVVQDAEGQVQAAAQGDAGTYTDFQGKKKHVKRWFGIWE